MRINVHLVASSYGFDVVVWFIVALYVAAYAVVGMAIGAITGWLVSLLKRSGRPRLLKNALLGSFGYFAGFIGCIFMPWPQNTVVKQLNNGVSVATTRNTYQHPERVAIAIAILLPLLQELYRSRKRNAASLT
jgi:hypothetical protein